MITIKEFRQMPPSTKGTVFAKAKVIVPSGKEISVTVFGDFPGFPLPVGSQVEGEIKEGKPYKGTPTFILSAPYGKRVSAPEWATQTPQNGGGAVQAAQITKESVERSQDRKEEHEERKEKHIEMTAAFRDATLLTVAYLGNRKELMSMTEVQDTWVNFREWLKGKIAEPF